MSTFLSVRALLEEGVPKKTIARRLGIDPRTVRRYAGRLAAGADARGQRPQGGPFVTREADQRRFPRGAVPAVVGHGRHPLLQVLLERGEGGERLVGQRVAFDVFHAGFRFPLGPRAIRRARARLHVPVATEGQIGRMKDRRAGGPVARPHQRP